MNFRWWTASHRLAFGTAILAVALGAYATLSTPARAETTGTPAPGQRGGGFVRVAQPATPPSWYRTSHALVIGIDRYTGEWPRLDAAVSDARRIKAELERQGFAVTVLEDGAATKAEILRQLNTVIPRVVGENDRFLFYFAGHGQTETLARGQGKSGYIVPADGSRVDGDQWHTYISMDELNRALRSKFRSKHVVAIFDSCFSGLALTRSGGVAATVESHLKKEGVMAITAGGEGELAQDGLFTTVLVKALQGQADRNNDGYVTFNEAALYTEQEVNRTNNGQMPRFGQLSGEGQVIFAASDAPPAPPATSEPAAYVPPPAPSATPTMRPQVQSFDAAILNAVGRACAVDNDCPGAMICTAAQRCEIEGQGCGVDTECPGTQVCEGFRCSDRR